MNPKGTSKRKYTLALKRYAICQMDIRTGNTHSRVRNPPIGLHERRRPEVLVLVPPVAGATGRAARAQDALVQPVELLAVVLRLKELALCGRVVVLEVRLDGLVLLIEQRQIGYEVLHDVHCTEAPLAEQGM